MSIRPSDKQKCPLDIQMSIHPLDEQKCPVNNEMSIRPMDRWTNGHCLMANTLSPIHMGLCSIILRHYSSSQWRSKSYMFIGYNEMSIGHTEMSILPSDKEKCPLDIQMSIRPLDEQKCPVDIEMSIRPMDRWTLSDGKHSSLLSTWGYAQSYYVIIALLTQ